MKFLFKRQGNEDEIDNEIPQAIRMKWTMNEKYNENDKVPI